MTIRPIILIVEDDDPLRTLLVELFDQSGFEVMEACDGPAAVTSLLSRPNLQAMLTDVHMPGEPDGFGLSRYVRALCPGCAILIASGLAQPKAEDLAFGTQFIRKPYRGSQAICLIQHLMAQQADRQVDPLIFQADPPDQSQQLDNAEDVLLPLQAGHPHFLVVRDRHLVAASECRRSADRSHQVIVQSGYLRVAMSHDLLARLSTSDLNAEPEPLLWVDLASRLHGNHRSATATIRTNDS